MDVVKTARRNGPLRTTTGRDDGRPPTRREMYAESTRRSLLDIGFRLFAERGFMAVSAEELVGEAGLTRGALYHHFDGKRGLFEAVFVELEERAARRIAGAMAACGTGAGGEDGRAAAGETGAVNLWAQALAGVEAFLDVCAEPDFREIVLIQGPIALGWERWRELDQRHLGVMLLDGVKTLIAAGLLRPHSAELTAAALYGALTEISLATARSADPAAVAAEREDAVRLVRTLLEGLRAAPLTHAPDSCP